jgi:hypothetical protein
MLSTTLLTHRGLGSVLADPSRDLQRCLVHTMHCIASMPGESLRTSLDKCSGFWILRSGRFDAMARAAHCASVTGPRTLTPVWSAGRSRSWGLCSGAAAAQAPRSARTRSSRGLALRAVLWRRTLSWSTCSAHTSHRSRYYLLRSTACPWGGACLPACVPACVLLLLRGGAICAGRGSVARNTDL